ncbi:MAG TPA: 6-bladed beta-propeller [Dissulfurispiraceae bacterium]|nr:6-bladed beta-propeller [Dissulfurispiraceae bacterium]
MKKLRFLYAALIMTIIIGGCAAPSKKAEETVFFPPPPDLPRIQYLTSFTSISDIEEQTAFNRFIVGEKEKKKLDKPYGIGIFDGKIYVCDTNETVTVFDLKGKTYGPLKGAKGPGKLMQPLNISISEDGTKYVTDPVRGQIIAFKRNDEYLRSYGLPGKWKPVDAAPFEDRLYVVDNLNAVINVFNIESGEVIKTIGDRGDAAERLNRPTNIAFDRAGDLYVTDAGKFQVLRYDRDGHFKSSIGKSGDFIGNFARPKGLAVDRQGRLYVVDAAFGNVQLFSNSGKVLLFFSEGGSEPGNLLLPAKVAIDYDNMQYFRKYMTQDFEVEYLILVTSQFGQRMVNVFGYGKEKGKKYPTDEELLKQLQDRKLREFKKLQDAGKMDAIDQERIPKTEESSVQQGETRRTEPSKKE